MDGFFISGRTEEELKKEKVFVDGKQVIIPKMKTKQVIESLNALKKVDWDGVTYAALVDLVIELAPSILGLSEESFMNGYLVKLYR